MAKDKHAVVMTKGGPRGETLSLVTKTGAKRDELRQTLSIWSRGDSDTEKKKYDFGKYPSVSTGKIDYVLLKRYSRISTPIPDTAFYL